MSRQVLKLFESNLTKNNSLINLVGISSDFEAILVFNYLIIETTLSVLTFWKVETLLDFLHLFFNSYYAWVVLKFCDDVINIIIIYIITIIIVKRSDTEASNNIYKIFIKSLSKFFIISDHFVSFYQGYSFSYLIFSTKYKLYMTFIN